MVFAADRELAGFDLGHFEPMLERMASIVELKYGFGYRRSFEFGPDVYALGMGAGLGYSDADIAERDRIGAWFRERMHDNRHRIGYLREVYPLNVISAPHLEQRIDGLALADWIAAEPNRGSLRQLAGGAMLWWIDDADADSVRAQLIPTGLLIAYQR
jgi:hypothetical protein